MTDRKIQTIDEYLKNSRRNKKKRKILNQKYRTRKFLATAGIVFVGLGGLISLASCKLFGKKNKNISEEPFNKPSISQIGTTSIDDLGIEVSLNEPTKKYVATTGNVDVNKIVKDNNGTVWANETAKSNSKNVGKEVVDLKNGTLEEKNGVVVEKQKSYEIKDKDGNVSTGTFDENTKYTPDEVPIPDNYVWDSGRGEMVKEEDLGKYKYDEDGNLVPADSKEQPKEEPKEETKEEITDNEVTDEGVVNSDGTYSIWGLTFESKADFEQWILQGKTGYVIEDGIMVPEQPINASEKQLVIR